MVTAVRTHRHRPSFLVIPRSINRFHRPFAAAMRHLVAFLACTIFAVSCIGLSDGDVAVNFGDIVTPYQSLVFTFEEDMVPDSIVDTWQSEEYLRFTPAAKGRCKWVSRSQLLFSPSGGFAPATDYTVEITDKVLLHDSGAAAMPTRRQFTFHTPYLTIEESTAQWAKNAVHGGADIRIALRFTYDVDEKEVAQRMRITMAGGQVPFALASRTSSADVIVTVPSSALGSNDAPSLHVAIDKGLGCSEGGSVTKTELTANVALASRSRLEVLYALPSWKGIDGVIDVATSQVIEPASLAGAVTIQPATAITVQPSDHGFRIHGAFTVGRTYTVTVGTQIVGEVGGRLSAPWSHELSFQEMEPTVAFVSESRTMYLGSRGGRALGIRIVNVPRVRVSVIRIYENNIQHAMRQAQTYNWSDDGERSTAYDFSWTDLADYGDTVTTKVYQASDLGASDNGVALLNVDVGRHTERRGMYVVLVESEEDRWLRDVRIVSMTDVGLIAKQGTDQLVVMANSLREAEPLDDVEIALISTNNQVIETVRTGSDGTVTIDGLRERLGAFRVAMLTARRGDDFTFMQLRDTEVDQSRFETGGWHPDPSGMQAWLYSERELYRPGEIIHMNTIVRDRSWNPMTIPVRLKVVMPNGREFTTMRLTPDAQGAAPCSIPLPAATVTGTYTVEAYGGRDVLLGSMDVAVEEFLPDRIKVNTTVAAQTLTVGTSVDCAVNALYYFGPAASGRRYTVSMAVRTAAFAPKRWPSATFVPYAEHGGTLRSDEREGTLDASGNAVATFTIDTSLANHGMLEAVFYVTVFDESGRPVHRIERRPVRTQPALFGIVRQDRYVAARQQLQIPVVACSEAGQPVSAKARFQLIRKEYHTVMENSGSGRMRYVSQKREVVIHDHVVDVQGDRTLVPVVPEVSGEYEIRLGPPGSSRYVRSTFYAFGWGSTASTSFAVNTEGLVDIVLDKDSYRPGDRASVLFKAPFAGTLLVTIERDGVLEHHRLRTDKRSASMTLPVSGAWLPNVYISATLIKPHVASDMPLTVAHGYQVLRVDDPQRRLPVSIRSATKARSGTKQTITVTSAPGAFVTIAAVDEGIMAIRNSATPDPYAAFYRKQALDVRSYDMYPLLYPEFGIGRRAYGAGSDDERRLNPFPVTQTALVSFWSGVLPVRNGTATYTIEVPAAFSGQLRVMAVAWKGNAFGSAATSLTVADPVVLAASVPRAMAPGDRVTVPVMVANTTDRAGTMTCRLSAGGPLAVVGAADQTITVEAGRERTAYFTVEATGGVGEGTVLASAEGLGETFRQTLRVPVRPAAPLTEVSGSGVVRGGATERFAIAGSFMAGTGRGRLVVSAFPATQYMDNLQELLGYPHGCLEQTISKAFPQLYLADLVKAWQKGAPTGDPVKNVQAAIRKVQSMQLYNGAFAYWPGGSEESWWGTAYAAHLLIEARQAGYEVQPHVLDRALQYLGRRVRMREVESVVTYQPDGGWVKERRAARDIFYSLYVLAAAGRQDLPTMNLYKTSTKDLTQDSRYMLACTYGMIGDRRSFDALVPASFREERYRPRNDGNFASPVRDMALALYGMVVAAPDDVRTATLARQLATTIRARGSHNTQENAFAVLALGKLAHRAAAAGATATVTIDGARTTVAAGTTSVVDVAPGQRVSVAAQGGAMYYCWIADGIPSAGEAISQEDRILRVRRDYFTRDGRPVTGTTFRQNDVVVVRVTLATTDGSTVQNVAVSDVLPGGFELENPRLGSWGEAAWLKDAATARYYDYRDDRMNLFVDAEATTRSYYYVVRAVSVGRFRQAPIGADAMYDDDVHSYAGGATVTISARE